MKVLFVDTLFDLAYYVFNPVTRPVQWGLRWYRDFDGTVVIYIDWEAQR